MNDDTVKFFDDICWTLIKSGEERLGRKMTINERMVTVCSPMLFCVVGPAFAYRIVPFDKQSDEILALAQNSEKNRMEPSRTEESDWSLDKLLGEIDVR